MVKIWTILNCAKKIFFGKIICSSHQRKCFSTILGNFRKIEFSTGTDLTKMVKICIISICAMKIFFGKIICSTHQRKCFSTILGSFSENLVFEGISTSTDLSKMVKICILSICAKIIFFGKIICFTHQRKCFSTILGSFWKIEFLKENRQARTLQKWWKIE